MPARRLVVLLVFALTACGGRGRSDAPILTIDDFGDTVRLAKPATRVVSLNPVTTELLFALGAGDKLVGRTHWDLHPSAARDVPDVGDGMRPNVETVIGRAPDLVLLYASPSNRAAVQQLHAAGVQTMSFRTDHVDDLARIAPLIAGALGDRARGAQVADTVMAAIAAVRALPETGVRPRAYWHVWDAPVLTIGRGSFLSELLTVAGGVNIFDDMAAPSPQVSLEEIARRDPDVILAGPAGAATIRAHPGWAAVRAVREGHVLVVDTALVGRPGVRMGEAARHLRALLHGDSAR